MNGSQNKDKNVISRNTREEIGESYERPTPEGNMPYKRTAKWHNILHTDIIARIAELKRYLISEEISQKLQNRT